MRCSFAILAYIPPPWIEGEVWKGHKGRKERKTLGIKDREKEGSNRFRALDSVLGCWRLSEKVREVTGTVSDLSVGPPCFFCWCCRPGSGLSGGKEAGRERWAGSWWRLCCLYSQSDHRATSPAVLPFLSRYPVQCIAQCRFFPEGILENNLQINMSWRCMNQSTTTLTSKWLAV